MLSILGDENLDCFVPVFSHAAELHVPGYTQGQTCQNRKYALSQQPDSGQDFGLILAKPVNRHKWCQMQAKVGNGSCSVQRQKSNGPSGAHAAVFCSAAVGVEALATDRPCHAIWS